MHLITPEKPMALKQLSQIAQTRFGTMTKGVVDIKKGIMVIDADLHSDQEQYLLENGSAQADLWGINLYPELTGDDFVEFDSMINLRPSQGNNSRGVDDLSIQKSIRDIVQKLIQP